MIVSILRNRKLLAVCKPLEEYSWLIARIRENSAADKNGDKIGIEEAINRAIDAMPDEFLIKECIISNRAEVMDMCLTEYNEAEVMEMFKEEGREEGTQAAIAACIKEIMGKLKYTADQAMDLLSIPDEERPTYAGMITEQ